MDTDTDKNSDYDDDDKDLDVEKKFDEFDDEIEDDIWATFPSQEEAMNYGKEFLEAKCEQLLTCNMDIDFISVLKHDTERNHEYCKRPTHNFSGKSPFPNIDRFIEYISTIGEVKENKGKRLKVFIEEKGKEDKADEDVLDIKKERSTSTFINSLLLETQSDENNTQSVDMQFDEITVQDDVDKKTSESKKIQCDK
nr:hypothetical protein [Tanacetum cinerariifolium]